MARRKHKGGKKGRGKGGFAAKMAEMKMMRGKGKRGMY